MRRQSNENQAIANRVAYSSPAVQARLYNAFLELHGLLEDYAPVWYTEALHETADAIIRECGGAEPRRQNERPIRRQKRLAHRSDFLSSEIKRQLATQAFV